MITKLLISFVLMALCVVVHATGLMRAIRRFDRSPALADTHFWPPTWMLIRIAGWLVLLHLVEISLWASLYAWGHAMPDAQSALYFSAVTYTTTGYGDLVLPENWRLLGGVEALTGILMCGWSTGFFFAILSNMYRLQHAKIPGNRSAADSSVHEAHPATSTLQRSACSDSGTDRPCDPRCGTDRGGNH